MLDYPVQFMGVNAPKEHQRMIRKITTGLDILYVAGQIKFEPFPETMISEGSSSPTPDVLLYDNITRSNIVLIEITTGDSLKKDFKKISNLIEEYEIEEGFVYEYQRKIWRKYKLGIGEVTENPSFCDAIGYDLNNFVK